MLLGQFLIGLSSLNDGFLMADDPAMILRFIDRDESGQRGHTQCFWQCHGPAARSGRVTIELTRSSGARDEEVGAVFDRLMEPSVTSRSAHEP
jgi:hypothetical protein